MHENKWKYLHGCILVVFHAVPRQCMPSPSISRLSVASQCDRPRATHKRRYSARVSAIYCTNRIIIDHRVRMHYISNFFFLSSSLRYFFLSSWADDTPSALSHYHRMLLLWVAMMIVLISCSFIASHRVYGVYECGAHESNTFSDASLHGASSITFSCAEHRLQHKRKRCRKEKWCRNEEDRTMLAARRRRRGSSQLYSYVNASMPQLISNVCNALPHTHFPHILFMLAMHIARVHIVVVTGMPKKERFSSVRPRPAPMPTTSIDRSSMYCFFYS